MGKSPKKIIYAMPRSGSSLMLNALHAYLEIENPSAINLGEYFSRTPGPQIDEKIKDLKKKYISKNRPIAIKIFPYHMLENRLVNIFDYFIENDYQFICLYRENLLNQLVSMGIQRHTQIAEGIDTEGTLEEESIDMDPEIPEMLKYSVDQFWRIISQIPNKIMLKYEDFETDLTRILDIFPGLCLNEKWVTEKSKYHGEPLRFFRNQEQLIEIAERLK